MKVYDKTISFVVYGLLLDGLTGYGKSIRYNCENDFFFRIACTFVAILTV